MMAVSCGKRAAPAAQPAAGVKPQRSMARPIPSMRSGRAGRAAPVPASTRIAANCDVIPMSISPAHVFVRAKRVTDVKRAA